MSHLKSWEGLLLAVLLAILVTYALRIDDFGPGGAVKFLTPANFVNMFALSIEKIIIALVMTFIIINAEIDLSVGSMMGLSACAFGFLWEQGVNPGVAIGACLLIGAAGGAMNGWFVARVGLPSLVVTLATMIGFRGAARVLAEDRSIGDFPDWFDALGQRGLIGPVTFGILAFVVLFALLYVVLERSGFGRKTYVIGVNREVADYAGIDTARHKIVLFTLSGLVAAFAGLLYAARLGNVRGDAGAGFELDVITMVLLGGVSIFGGTGTLRGVFLAILIVLSLRNGMGLENTTGHIQTGVVGLLLIASVLVPRIRLWQRRAA